MDEDDFQQFNLRWHNHQTSIMGALGRMYQSGALTDVTLSAGGTVMKAHRLVLASCSQYFGNLFKEVEPEANTLVVVLGCSALELRMLLAFMYTGEVTASRRTLPALLRLANTLKVAGLTDADQTNPSATAEMDTREDTMLPADAISPMNLETRPEPNDNSSSLDNNNSNNFRFNFEDLTGTSGERKASESVDFSAKCDERLSKLDQIVQNLYSTHRIEGPIAAPIIPPATSSMKEPAHSRKWRHGSVCRICNKRLSNQYNLRVHMDTHAGGRHACRACSHVSRSRDALRKHVAYRHPQPQPARER